MPPLTVWRRDPSRRSAAERVQQWSRRLDQLLTPDRLVVYPVIITVLFLVVWGLALRTTLPLPDHLARWTAGRMVVDGQTSSLYDPALQSTVQSAQGATALSWFVSPPYVALAFVPFGLLPYAVSAVLWTLVSMGLLLWSMRALSALHPAFGALRRRGVLLIVVSCQPVLELVGAGQDSVVVLAAMVLGATLLTRGSPAVAGLVLSLTAIKPQLALLVPLVLLVGKAWRALAGLAAGGLTIAVITVVLLGQRVWQDWLHVLRSPLYQREVVEGQAWKTSTLKGLIDSVGAGAPRHFLTACWLVAITVVLLATFRKIAWWRRAGAPLLLLTLAPVVTVLVTPHALVYDLVILLPGAVWLVGSARSPQSRALVAVAYVVLFLGPLLHLAAAMAPWPLTVVGAPWVVLFLLGVWSQSLRRLERTVRSGDAGVGRQPRHS